MGRRIWQMVKKEFIQVWRDRRLRIFLFLPPIVQLVIYGYAINFDIKQVPFAVYDEDRTQASEVLISSWGGSCGEERLLPVPFYSLLVCVMSNE